MGGDPTRSTFEAAALRVLAEPGWRLLVEAGLAVDAEPRDALRAAEHLRARRPDAPAEERAAALELVGEGRRLAAKLGLDESLLAVRGAVEQATSARVATWHAQQLPEGCRLLEIGCGCGGDSLALAHRAANLIATDVDPVRAACAHTNLMALGLGSARALVADGLAALDGDASRADAVFVDPDRRPGGVRTLDPERWSPPLSALRDLAAGTRPVFVKAASALDPDAAGPRFAVSYVSHGGACVEAFLASDGRGDAPEPRVRAVLLPDDGPSLVLAGNRADAPTRALGPALYVPDPAAVRARLLAELCERHALGLVSDGIALLTGDAGVVTPWLTEHAVLESLPLHRKRLRARIAALAPADLRVHCRGVAETAPALERVLRAGLPERAASEPLDVFATRVAGVPTAVLTRSPC